MHICRPGDPVNDVWSAIKKRCVKNTPVVDHHSIPIGILNAKDALQTLHGADELGAVAHVLNSRPCMTLGYRTPAEALNGLRKSGMIEGVAATG